MKPDPVQSSDGTQGGPPALKAPESPVGVADFACDDVREPIEPTEDYLPLPMWLVAFVGTLLFVGGIYTQRYSGGYGAMVYDENAASGLAKTNVVAPIDPYVLGRRLYADTCAKCHQADGQGVAGQYPPLAGSDWVLAPGPARMIRIVLDALQGPVQVKGKEYNNTMTPWRDTLNDQQIAAIVTYVRTHKEWGHTASPVTAEEVAAIRAKTKGRPGTIPWTVPELMAIPDHEPPK